MKNIYYGSKHLTVQKPSGDYWHTTCANKVEEADMGNVTYSDYHQTYKVVDGNCERDEDDELMDVLILQ